MARPHGRPNRIVRHGVLRTLAQLGAGEQSALAVQRTEAWLAANPAITIDALFRSIREAVAPRGVVEKSPPSAFADAHCARLARFAPQARVVHVTRHAFGYARS